MENPEAYFFNTSQYEYSEKYVLDCVASGYAGRIGKYVETCSETIAKMFNANCLLVANGTIALELALRTIGIERDDFVLIPSISFVATVNAVLSVGANPVFVNNIKDDIFPDINNIEYCLKNKKIKAVVLAHLYGFPAPYTKEIKELCDKFNVFLIEDNAQSFGSFHEEGLLVGSYGDISTVSFFSNKVISCGQGGALIFNNRDLYEKANSISNHGRVKDEFKIFGGNYSFNNLSASLLLGSLENMSNILKYRDKIYQTYLLHIEKLKLNVQVYNFKTNSVRWVLPLQINSNVDISILINRLNSVGIACRSGMSFLPHLPHINKVDSEYYGKRPDDILLPIHTALNEVSLLKILNILKEEIQ